MVNIVLHEIEDVAMVMKWSHILWWFSCTVYQVLLPGTAE